MYLLLWESKQKKVTSRAPIWADKESVFLQNRMLLFWATVTYSSQLTENTYTHQTDLHTLSHSRVEDVVVLEAHTHTYKWILNYNLFNF